MLKWLICLVMFSCRVGRGCYSLIMDKRCLRESNAPKVLLTSVVNSVVPVVPGIPYKIDHAAFFSFQLSSFSSLFQDVFNQLNWQFHHFQYTLPLTPCSKTSQEFFTHYPKLFYSPLTHPSQLISRPDLHPPLTHTTYQHLILNGKHHSLSTPF